MPLHEIAGEDPGDFLIGFDEVDVNLPEVEQSLTSGTDRKLARKEAATGGSGSSDAGRGDVLTAFNRCDRWVATTARDDADCARVSAQRPELKLFVVGRHWPSILWVVNVLPGLRRMLSEDCADPRGPLSTGQRLADQAATRSLEERC